MSNSHRRPFYPALVHQRTFVPALLHQLSRTDFPIHTEDFRSSAAPPTVKDRFSNSHRRFSIQRCSTNCQGQVLQFAPKTFVPALLHQLSRTGSPIHTEHFRSSAAPPTVEDRFSNSHRALSLQRCSTNCRGQVLQFKPKTFVSALLHQLSRTGSPIYTEDFRSSAAPPTVKDRFSNSHRRLSFQRCSTNCKGQVFQFKPKILAPALLHQLSRTVSLQRCSTNCQGQVLQFAPKTFAPALLHQPSRTSSPLHTEDFRSNAAPPTVKDKFSTEDFRSSAAPPTVKDRFSNSHRRLSIQRCSTNCQRQDLQFAPKTFVPALLHQLSRTVSPIHSENFRSSASPSTVKDKLSNSHRRLSIQRWSTNRLSFQRCSTNCQGQVFQFTPKTFDPALLHQLSRTGSPIRTEDFRSSAAPPIHTEDFRSSAAPPTVKDRFSNSQRKLSLQRCSTNCQGQVLQFTPNTFAPALLHQLSRTGSPIHTEDFRFSAAPPTVKDKFSNSNRRLSFQRCSTNCQGQVLQFTPKTFVPALLHQLSRTSFPIHTEDFPSSAAPPTFKDSFAPTLLHEWSRTSSPIHTEDFRSSAAPQIVKDRISNSHRRLSLQRCSTNRQGQVLHFTPKTFVPTLLHQLSRTNSPIHTENFRSNAAPPIVIDRFSTEDFRSNPAPPTGQGNNLQFTPKTFAPALLHELSRTSSPIHTEDFRSSAAPPIVKDMFSNSHRRLSFQRSSTNCQRQILQFIPKTFVPALFHQLSKTGSPIHTEDFRSSAAPPTVKDEFSNSYRRLSLQRCSTNCQGQGTTLERKFSV